MQVTIFDSRTTQNLKAFLLMALPSMLRTVMEFCSFDILVLMAGIISVKAQAVLVTLFAISYVGYMAFYGV